MKKFLLTLALVLCSLGTWAYDACVDGIYYLITNSTFTATVTFQSSNYNSYSGDVVIPETIIYNNINYSVTGIGSKAFYKCSGLTSVTIPNSVTSIGDYAFYDCSKLTSVTIPNSVTSIGYEAFASCDVLASVTIPDSVTSIGSSAFYNCDGLTSATIGNSVKSLGEDAFGCCSKLTSVTIGNSVTTIGASAFYECKCLTSVTIPNSVTSIKTKAFYNCTGLTYVTLGNSVTTIGESAFYGCYNLRSVKCLGETAPSCGMDMFTCSTTYVHDAYDVYTYARLHVPMGSKDDYAAAYEWRYFKNIKEDLEMDGNVYYTTLAIKSGDEGYTQHYVKNDETYTLEIGSDTQHVINCVKFNGEDVTDQMIDGILTTPVINRPSVLAITYESTPSGIAAVSNPDLKVYGYDGQLIISGINGESNVAVYTIDGKLIKQENLSSSTEEIGLENGAYVVKVDDRTFKVAM